MHFYDVHYAVLGTFMYESFFNQIHYFENIK